MITNIQIQTIDSCNSRCVICPYKDVSHNFHSMEMSLYKKIIRDIKELVGSKIYHKSAVHFELSNEPLLDLFLYDRINFLKTEIPSFKILIITNAILLHQQKEKLLECLRKEDTLRVSLYGSDASSFNSFTQLNISESKYQEIVSSINYLKTKNAFNIEVIRWAAINQINGKYDSRADFYKKKTKYHDKIFGCSYNRENFLTIIDNGDILLCCMDFKKETKTENLLFMSLKSYFESKSYRKIMKKMKGRTESENDFICKRCEYAITNDKSCAIVSDKKLNLNYSVPIINFYQIHSFDRILYLDRDYEIDVEDIFKQLEEARELLHFEGASLDQEVYDYFKVKLNKNIFAAKISENGNINRVLKALKGEFNFDFFRDRIYNGLIPK